MPPIQFGWITPVLGFAKTGYTPAAITQQDAVLPAVSRVFDSLWVYDHLFGLDDPADPWLEGWTTLTWLAARYPGMRVGTVVLGTGYRNPALLAKMAATLQALSGGRLVLGLGAGWRAEEHRAYGFAFPDGRARREALDEAVTIIRHMWTEPAPSFTGRQVHIAAAYCEPRPDPPPPILIGSFGTRILDVVARQADWWDCWAWSMDALDPADYLAKRALLDARATAAGRDPTAIVRSVSATLCRLPRTPDESAQWLDRLRPFVDAGVTHFLFDFGPVSALDRIERFAAEVIGPINAYAAGR